MKPELAFNELSLDVELTAEASLLQTELGDVARMVRDLGLRGFPRSIRVAEGALDRPFGPFTLRRALFARGPSLEERRLLATRLDRQPYLDGLLARAVGDRITEATIDGIRALGLELAWVTDGLAVSIDREPFAAPHVSVDVVSVADGPIEEGTAEVRNASCAEHLDTHADFVASAQLQGLAQGRDVADAWESRFPCLTLGPDAERQLRDLDRGRRGYPHVLHALQWLNRCARTYLEDGREDWTDEVRWSHESKATRTHGRYGPMRDFALPPGVPAARVSHHAKINVDGLRVYFHPTVREAPVGRQQRTVIVAYIGPHLPSVEFPG